MSDVKNKKVPPASVTPTPTSATLAPPSPLQIGKAFIKQYYQVLSTNPTQITKFYKPNSVISHSLLPSVPAEPKTLADLMQQDDDSQHIFKWCRPKENENALCFDFGRGAIDAHETINGGILLVVTGHMKLPSDHQTTEGMKKFVQTFFLNNGAPTGKKRQFYVHNDVLRFLDGASNGSDMLKNVVDVKDDVTEGTKIMVIEKDEAAEASVNTETVSNVDTKDDEQKSADVMIVKAGLSTEANDYTTDIEVEGISPPSGDDRKVPEAEMTKDEISNDACIDDAGVDKAEGAIASETYSKAIKSEENKPAGNLNSEKKGIETSATNTNQEKKGRKNKSRGRSRKSRSSSPTDGDNIISRKTDVPGSWASLVAGGSGPSAVAAAAASAAAKTKREDKSNVCADNISQRVDELDGFSNGKQKVDTPGKDITNETGNADQQPKQQSNKKANAPVQRTPEATILIKNIPDRTKEGEIRTMFEPYAAKLQKKILGITLLASRGFCFVDFDSKVVVDEIVKDVEMEKSAAKNKDGNDTAVNKLFVINGKALEVGRKIPDKIGGGRGRGFRRSASPGNYGGGGFNKSNRSGGGRKGSPRSGGKPNKK